MLPPKDMRSYTERKFSHHCHLSEGKYPQILQLFLSFLKKQKKKFMDAWKNTTVDVDSDNARRLKIEEVLKPMIGGSDKSKVVIESAKRIISKNSKS